MKKVLAIALVLCLVMGAVFAAKGDIKVGAQLGYVGGFSRQKVSEGNDYMKVKASVGGFGFEAAGLYDVTDEVSVKAAFGLVFFGKNAKVTVNTHIEGLPDSTDSDTVEVDAPVQFSFYLGGQYAFEVTKEIKVAAGAGLDLTFGKDSKDDDAKSSLSLGLGAEVTGTYAINKNIDVLLGARYSFYFVDTDENLKKEKEAYEALGAKFSYSSSALRIFAGCTYKI